MVTDLDRARRRRRLKRALDSITFNLTITWTPRSPDELATPWTVTAYLDDFEALDEGTSAYEPDPIFWMNGWLFPVLPHGITMAYALDAVDADTEVFVPLTDSAGELAGEYQNGTGSHLVAVDKVRLERQWRGMGGLGIYLAGSAFLLLSDYAICIALHPKPFELLEGREERDLSQEEYARATKKLTRLWSTLSAEPAPGKNLVIGPSLIGLCNAVDGLHARLSGSKQPLERSR
ncbi:hypothetical protein [Promicromonospora iranensis]|uniref:Uncharacterized protein n=1 Tax=Promicromonospora iranensis TaxID=1105144 RepID=A0ABU2CIR3_9MICO|nr:hypothetical protein [Promicromonospora iranensis]MDR7381198.1 hypothetical protein [Promicromonospora iranensis]